MKTLDFLLNPVGRTSPAGLVLLALGVGVVLTLVSGAVGLALGAPVPSVLEIAAVLTSFACTYLCNARSRLNYPLGAISVAMYAWLTWQAGLVGSAVLNVYLVPVLIFGWWRWRSDASPRPIQHLKAAMIPVYLALTAGVYLVCVWIVTSLGGALAPLDTAILVLSVLAQLLLDNKKMETWIVWVMVNVVAIYVYATSGLTLVTAQYVFFLFNTLIGWYAWHKEYTAPPLKVTTLRRTGGAPFGLPYGDIGDWQDRLEQLDDSERTKALGEGHFTAKSAETFVAAHPGLSGHELEALDAEQEDEVLRGKSWGDVR